VNDGVLWNRMGFDGIQSHIEREREREREIARRCASQILICGYSVFNYTPLKFLIIEVC